MDEFDAKMKIAAWVIGRCDARRQFEWRLLFALWALLVGAIGYFTAVQFSWVVGLVIFGLLVMWLWGVRKRNKEDTNIAWRAVRGANEGLATPIAIGDFNQDWFEKRFGIFGHWSHGVQLLSTALLLAIFYLTKVQCVTWWCFAGLTIQK